METDRKFHSMAEFEGEYYPLRVASKTNVVAVNDPTINGQKTALSLLGFLKS